MVSGKKNRGLALVHDNASEPDKRGALEAIAGKPAPTDIAGSIVGAGLPAMVVNDNACIQDKRGALESIAGRPAPTRIALQDSFQRRQKKRVSSASMLSLPAPDNNNGVSATR
ncbi:hypothetical protein EI969_11575 [Pseudomonas sp. PB101]|nr:hypothetical protein [Pseudomonas sp. PB101]